MHQSPAQCVRLLISAIGALACLTPAATAQGNPLPLQLLNTTLEAEQIRARTLSTAGLVVLDELDIPRLRGWESVLVARQTDRTSFSMQIDQVPGPDLVGWAVLADGQRHRVWPNPPSSANPDVLDVTLADGTEWSIPLEALHALVFWSQPSDTPPSRDDTVRLANGDAISGFVESIGDSVIVDSTQVPLDRVASITLANPAEPASVMLIDLADGSVVGASAISPTDHGQVSIELVLTGHNDETSSPRLTVDPEDILAIRPVHESLQLIPMATLEPLSFKPLGGRRWTPPPWISQRRTPADLRWIVYPGPMEVVYALPAGSRWFRAEILLSSAQWAEAELEVLIERPGGARESLTQLELNHSGATGTLHTPLPEDAVRLVIRLGAGERGPINDRVVLRYPALVVEN